MINYRLFAQWRTRWGDRVGTDHSFRDNAVFGRTIVDIREVPPGRRIGDMNSRLWVAERFLRPIDIVRFLALAFAKASRSVRYDFS